MKWLWIPESICWGTAVAVALNLLWHIYRRLVWMSHTGLTVGEHTLGQLRLAIFLSALVAAFLVRLALKLREWQRGGH